MKKHTSLPLTSAHWGTYRVESCNGKVSALHGFEQDDDVSPIGAGITEVLEGPTRILAPAIRRSWLESGPGSCTHRRGTDPFVSVSWETAEKLVAGELDRTRKKFGNQAIYAGSYGWASAGRFHHAQSQIHRFMNCIGGYTRSRDTYSFAAGEVILPHVMGNLYAFLAFTTSWPSIARNTDLLVAFGGMPLKNGQINSGGVGRHTQQENLRMAVEAGLQIVNVSPIRSDVADFANAQWIAPRPNTDTAVLIAIAHTLYSENLHDQEFLNRYTCGFERFAAYLTGRTDGVVKNATWASRISQLPQREILDLARSMARGRTMISLSWSLTRQDHGEQAFWAGVTVAAMLGQIGLPGGGVGFGYSATNSVGDHGTKIPGASLPQGSNPVQTYIPVARISDMLLHPGERYSYNGESRIYPDIHVVYWAGGNPFHHHQDINRLLRAWQKPDTVIVHEWCWNSLAKHADIVLPCTTTLERNDLAFSPRDPFAVFMEKAAEAPGQARNDYDILSGISRHMGAYEAFTEERNEAEWLKWIYMQTRENSRKRGISMPDYDSFRAKRWFAPPPPDTPTILLDAFRKDPDNYPLKTPSGKIQIFCPTIDRFGYADCPGHPVWMEPLEWLGNADQFPLHLISNQPSTRLHSQLDHAPYSRASKVNGREPIAINPSEARRRGLKHGDVVRVHNNRGACLAGLVIDDGIRNSVAQMSTGAWFDPLEPGTPGSLCKHGNPNMLTPDKGSSQLSQGPIAQTCLVEIEKFNGPLPPVTAFEPPQIL